MIAALATDREAIQHAPTKGAATELHWLKMLDDYLPKRYCADNAFVLDCEGNRSDQIDIVIYDRQYSPFLFNQGGAKNVPAESVYAVFEVKPNIDAGKIAYAGAKAESVRKLRRTSVPIRHAGGRFDPIEPPYIFAGILALESSWNPPLGEPLVDALGKLERPQRLECGCALRSGSFEATYDADGKPELKTGSSETALIRFFLGLLARLQAAGTVAALDFGEYGKLL